jgi:hypothetical protein
LICVSFLAGEPCWAAKCCPGGAYC